MIIDQNLATYFISYPHQLIVSQTINNWAYRDLMTDLGELPRPEGQGLLVVLDK